MRTIEDVRKLFSMMIFIAEKNFLNIANINWDGSIEIWEDSFACGASNFFLDFNRFSLYVGDQLLKDDCPTYILVAALAHEIGHMATGNNELLCNLHWRDWEKDIDFPRYHRGAEFQADIFACKLCAMMGYNPLSIGYYLRGVERRTGSGMEDSDSHPCTNRRNEQIIKFCSKPF